MRITLALSLVAALSTFSIGQDPVVADPIRPSASEELTMAVRALTSRIDALTSTDSGPPVVPAEAGCDGVLIESMPCGTRQTVTNWSVPVATQQRITQWQMPTHVQTMRTQKAPIAQRIDPVPTFTWNVGWFDLLRLKHRAEMRQVGPYLIETKPRLLGLFGHEVRVFQ